MALWTFGALNWPPASAPRLGRRLAPGRVAAVSFWRPLSDALTDDRQSLNATATTRGRWLN